MSEQLPVVATGTMLNEGVILAVAELNIPGSCGKVPFVGRPSARRAAELSRSSAG